MTHTMKKKNHKTFLLLTLFVISPFLAEAVGVTPAIETLDMMSFLSGSLAVVVAIATIILAVACFGGCATVTLLLPVILFLAGGITGIVTGLMSFRKRKQLRNAKKGRWKPITGLGTGILTAGYGILALLGLLSD